MGAAPISLWLHQSVILTLQGSRNSGQYGDVGSHDSFRMKPAICLALLAIVPPATLIGEAPLEPVTVCEVLKDPKLYDGRVVALLGRYSYRTEGRWIGEDACKTPENSTSTPSPEIIWLSYAPDSAPRMVSGYTVDGAAVAQKLL